MTQSLTICNFKQNCGILQISDTWSSPDHAASVHIPFLGWFIYGGANSLTVSQRLRHIDGTWEYGAKLYEHKSDYGQCLVQVEFIYFLSNYFAEICH